MTTETLQPPTAAFSPDRVQHILQRSVCLVLRCGRLGNHRRVELSSVKMEKDGETLEGAKSEVGATKKLFSGADLRPCEMAVASVQQRLRSMSVDGGTRLFGDGTYLLPLLAVPEALRVLREGREHVAAKAAELAGKLPAMVEQRKEKLGPLFAAKDYPTEDEVKAAYRIDWNFVAFDTPEQLMEVDEAAYEAAVHDQQVRMHEAYDDIIAGLREGAMTVMRELASKLKPGADGKQKALQPTALRDLQDLLQRLPVLNSIGEDEDLMQAVARVQGLSEGLDVETLRKAPAVRSMLQAEAEKAAAALEGLVLTGRRAMNV